MLIEVQHVVSVTMHYVRSFICFVWFLFVLTEEFMTDWHLYRKRSLMK